MRPSGVVVRRDHPKLISAIDWVVRNGGLRPVLPGVYQIIAMVREAIEMLTAKP